MPAVPSPVPCRARPTQGGGPRQPACCLNTSSVPGPPPPTPSPALGLSPGSPGTHFFPLSFQLFPQLLQSPVLLGTQGRLLSLLRGLHVLPELLQHPSVPLFQAGPLGLLERLELFSQPLQGSLLLGPAQTEGMGQAWALGGHLMWQEAGGAPSPALALVGLCAGPRLGREPAVLLSRPSLLFLGGLAQRLLQGTGERKKGKLVGGTALLALSPDSQPPQGRGLSAKFPKSGSCCLPVIHPR